MRLITLMCHYSSQARFEAFLKEQRNDWSGAVLRQLRKERDKLNRAIEALSGRRGKRKLSVAGRKRIAAAQRARWANYKSKKH
jgi:hypothetical protein